jgi:hypothetical protein
MRLSRISTEAGIYAPHPTDAGKTIGRSVRLTAELAETDQPRHAARDLHSKAIAFLSDCDGVPISRIVEVLPVEPPPPPPLPAPKPFAALPAPTEKVPLAEALRRLCHGRPQDEQRFLRTLAAEVEVSGVPTGNFKLSV